MHLFPSISLFNLANLLLGGTLLVLFIRYLWVVYFRREVVPVTWERALKAGAISPVLARLARSYRDRQRFFTWWLQVERLKREKVPGVFAELGVYKGDSAAVLHAMDPGRPFHLYDTFTGFPLKDLRVETGEAATYTPDNFADTTIAMVMKNISGNENIRLHPGYFPQTFGLFDEPVALANIDADLYLPTRAGLECFYPLLPPGGVILVHDYNEKWPGVTRAVDEFMATIPENLFHLPDRDGTVMIIRNK